MVATVHISKKNQDIINDKGNEILEFYKINNTVSDVIKEFGVTRNAVTKFLKESGVFTGLFNQKARADKRMKTLQSRYGITNFGQTETMKQRLKERNNIAYVVPSFNDQFLLYKKKVINITYKNKKFLVDSQYCYFTGIFFGDNFGPVNPNDPIKKSLDHKISIAEGFFNGLSEEVIGGVSNLCWCIRYCNSLKGNMSAEAFIPLAKHIRGAFINAGYKHN